MEDLKLYAVSIGKKIYVYDLKKRELVREIATTKDLFLYDRIKNTSKVVCSTTSIGTIDLESAEKTFFDDTEYAQVILQLDNFIITNGDEPKDIFIIDMETNQRIHIENQNNSMVYDACLMKAYTLVYSGYQFLSFYDLKERQHIHSMQFSLQIIWSAAYMPSMDRIIVAGDGICIIDPTKYETLLWISAEDVLTANNSYSFVSTYADSIVLFSDSELQLWNIHDMTVPYHSQSFSDMVGINPRFHDDLIYFINAGEITCLNASGESTRSRLQRTLLHSCDHFYDVDIK
jgi:hypothetical protein